jgi:hypothetical protein
MLCTHKYTVNAETRKEYKFVSCESRAADSGTSLRSEFFLRPTVSRSVRLGIGLTLGPLTRFYLALLFSFDSYFILFPTAFSLTRKRVCSLQCLHSLVRQLTTNNHTLPSHLRLFPFCRLLRLAGTTMEVF